MKITRKAIVAALAIMLPISPTGGCGSQTASNQSASADSQSSNAKDSQDASDDGEEKSLASGLSGFCDGDSDLMPAARVETIGQDLGISIDGFDNVKALDAKQFYAYTLMVKNPGSNGTWYQVNLTDFTESGETKQEITNLSTNDSNEYPGWNFSDDDATFETTIPDTMIHQKDGNPTWMLALTVDGEEMAHCPADGDADLK
uniref:hypothetical protein n=1 Tax=Bifidobacterium adolescentis TaxID=1680 RepID=UPI00359C11D2